MLKGSLFAAISGRGPYHTLNLAEDIRVERGEVECDPHGPRVTMRFSETGLSSFMKREERTDLSSEHETRSERIGERRGDG